MTELAEKRVFLSYARQDQRQVEEVAVKLRADGYTVFFDKKSLTTGRFDLEIRREVQRCDLFVVFVSRNSMRQGSYVLTELGYAEESWSDPSSHVLAVYTDDVTAELVPAYLRAVVNIRRIQGNIATGAYNLIVRHLAGGLQNNAVQNLPMEELSVADCSAKLCRLLSERRKRQRNGASTTDLTRYIDSLVAIINLRFQPQEDSIVAGARLVKRIGSGNFGTVWEAHEVATQRLVAVKVFRLDRLTQGQMLSRFRKSIRAMRLLGEERRLAKQHEVVGAVVKFFQQDTSELAFSMELLRDNLDDVSNFNWTLPHKLNIITRICAAVAYSHANGIIHRDIKPANIVLNDLGEPVLTDFDIADVKFATSMSTVEGALGTPIFAAPEQLQDPDLADERSDIYSLGRVLHYLLIERSPGYQVEKDPALSDLGQFPPALVEVVRRATQYDGRRRFESVNQMIQALTACQTGAASLRARALRFQRWAHQNWAMLVILTLVGTGSAITLAFQSASASREAMYQARLSQLSAKLSSLLSEKERARSELEDTERDIRELLRQQKSDHPPDVQVLEAAMVRRDMARVAVDRYEREQRQLEQEIQAAANTSRPETKPNSVLKGVTMVRGTSLREIDGAHVVPPRPCRQSGSCRAFGQCTDQNGECVAASDEDCKKSLECGTRGHCTVRDGQCQVVTNSDCHMTTRCANSGLCTAQDGTCIVAADEDCINALVCKQNGACTMRDGACAVVSNDDCRKKSSLCSHSGLCTARDGVCGAASSDECRGSAICGQQGMCTAHDGECVATSNADCSRTSLCKQSGFCTARDGKCAIATDDDCYATPKCKRAGLCTAQDGRCMAASDDDCRGAAVCKDHGKCSARNGVCI